VGLAEWKTLLRRCGAALRYAMLRPLNGLLIAAIALFATQPYYSLENRKAAPADPVSIKLNESRESPLDLEVGGELTGLARGSTRYISREALLALPQTTFKVSDDSNFKGGAGVSGVSLEELARALSSSPLNVLVVAICNDQYRANYSKEYVAAHAPLLVLKINGQPPEGWPKDSEGHGWDMGPYLISHAKFTPSFKIFSNAEEAQIPWGVVRLEFRNEEKVFGAIAPRGPHASDEIVKAGFTIARQNCFRCHNMGEEGGTKAGRPWPVLSAWAEASPESFAGYVRNPKAKNPHAQMPGNPEYDGETIRALTAYFRTFSAGAKGEKP
jgi:mono/diheme cytochrome c family protein